MLFEQRIAANGHSIHLAVRQAAAGWDVQEAFDSAIVHVEHYDDWHRVERAMQRLEREAHRHDEADTAHR
jgi:hypothetical protein